MSLNRQYFVQHVHCIYCLTVSDNMKELRYVIPFPYIGMLKEKYQS